MRAALLGVVLACTALTVLGDLNLVEYLPTSAPEGWIPDPIDARPNLQQRNALIFALHQRNTDLLERRLLEIASPKSPNYGNHMTLDDLTNLIAPPTENVDRVVQWLQGKGVEVAKVAINRDFLETEPITLEDVQNLLGCTLERFVHARHKAISVVRSLESYSLPAEIAEVVDFVVGIHGFPYVEKTRKSASELALLHVQAPGVHLITPPALYTAYNVTEPTGPPAVGNSSTQAVVEFQKQYFSPKDLQTFFTKYLPSLEGQVIEKIYGVNHPGGNPSVEANLDTQYEMAMGNYIPTSVYSYSEGGSIEDNFLTWVIEVNNQTDPPLVQSVSYGAYGGNYPNATVQRLTMEWAKMSARGVSVLFASGDDGVGCGHGCKAFEFPFPSSPYVTLVGGTRFEGGPGGREVAWSGSSGGFSTDYWRPQWQAAAVDAYLVAAKNNGTLPASHFFPADGRALPDISAVASNVAVVISGTVNPVAGTSCAAPTVSGMISLMNAERATLGKAPLGWLNPLIYEYPEAFNDITEGSNPDGCCPGFKASEGWDPVTGMGSPNYGKWLDIVLQLQ